ncbi:hypothetical protein [Streptococcus mitis]|nr:hypothetical protein [Streptococcus mitis]
MKRVSVNRDHSSDEAYKIVDGDFEIDEEGAEVIRIIYDSLKPALCQL